MTNLHSHAENLYKSKFLAIFSKHPVACYPICFIVSELLTNSSKQTSNTRTSKMTTKTDKNGRTWEYNDAEGCYTRGSVTIGCGAKNGSKWMNWNEPRSEEYKTLTEAMDQLGYESDQ